MRRISIGKERVGNIFKSFVEAELAVSGFTLTAPTVAERKSPGLRQGVYWFGNVEAYEPEQGFFAASTFWSFTHELDDGPPMAQGGNDRLSGVYPEGVMETGSLDEDRIVTALRRLVKSNLPLLNRFPDTVSLLSEAERYPGSAQYLLGLDALASRFNLAHCLETNGLKADAKEVYALIASMGGRNPNRLVRAYLSAAERHVKALSEEASS